MSGERLRVPDVLASPRDHALICTFGADLAFYEGPLWSGVARARNRIILADGGMLARHLSDEASGGSRLRHTNTNYVVAPITNAGSAHAKLILLADSAAGTLLVGSGNLGIDGYASQGEVFCRYDVGIGDSSQLGAFLAVKELLDTMGERGYLDAQALRHIDALWAAATWIWGSAPDGVRPVRHNLFTPLADQLATAVGGEPVLDVVLHAPFFDPDCEALRRLIGGLHPAHTTILLQERHTSVDPAKLARVLQTSGTRADVRLAAAPDSPSTYLHAKFILVRTATRAVNIVGSANLSLAALFRTDRAMAGAPAGNIEVVNLLIGEPEAYDALLAGLTLTEPGSSVAALNVRYRGNDDVEPGDGRPILQRGTWSDGVLRLEPASPLPPGQLALVISGSIFPASISTHAGWVRAIPDPGATAILDQRVVPVWLRIDSGAGVIDTTPVYPYHPESLAGMLTERRDPELLRKVGSLDAAVDDPELLAILGELEATLVVDATSLWRLAKASPPPGSGDAGPHVLWEELDFEALRRHPKVAQYGFLLRRQADAVENSELQIVLGSILEQFRGLERHTEREGSEPTPSPPPSAADLDELGVDFVAADAALGDQTPEEIEASVAAAAEGPGQRLATANRNRAAWQRFCDRFAAGFRDPTYVGFVGPGATVLNAIIFNHLLTVLVGKGVLAPDRGVAQQIELWAFLWGGATKPGYLSELDDETRAAAIKVIREHGGEATLLRGVDQAAQLIRSDHAQMLRVKLRLQWRHLLESPLLILDGEALRASEVPTIRNAADVSRELDKLAREWGPQELREAVSACLGWSGIQVWTEPEKVIRGGPLETIEVLKIEAADARLDGLGASTVLAHWAAVDTRRDYYRVHQPSTQTTAVWDRVTRECWWFARNTHSDSVALDEPTWAEPPWSMSSRKLVEAGAGLDELSP